MGCSGGEVKIKGGVNLSILYGTVVLILVLMDTYITPQVSPPGPDRCPVHRDRSLVDPLKNPGQGRCHLLEPLKNSGQGRYHLLDLF
jgi:hypothetical protein